MKPMNLTPRKRLVPTARFYGASGTLTPEDRTMRRLDMEIMLMNWWKFDDAPMAIIYFEEKEFVDTNALYQCALNVVNHSLKGKVELYYNAKFSKRQVTVIRKETK